MKIAIGTLAVLATTLVKVGPAAAACPSVPQVMDFALRFVSSDNNMIIGNIATPQGSKVAVCNATTNVAEWPIISPGGASFIQPALNKFTRVCLGAGNDKLRIMRATDAPVSCGGATFTALDYGTQLLQMVGGDGNDVIIGGDGRDLVDFSSDVTLTTATLEIATTGKGNDVISGGRYGQTDAWGGSGNDVYAGYGSIFNVRDLSGLGDAYAGSVGGADHFCDVGSLISGIVTCGGDAGDFTNGLSPAQGCGADLFGFCAAQAFAPLPFPAVDQ